MGFDKVLPNLSLSESLMDYLEPETQCSHSPFLGEGRKGRDVFPFHWEAKLFGRL